MSSKFNSWLEHHKSLLGIRQVGLRHLILIQAFPGSNPGSSATSVLSSMDRMRCFELRDVGSIPAGPAIKENIMKAMTFKNRMNGERFVCEDVKTVEVIDGIEYLFVHRPNEQRMFKMRKDALVKEVTQNLTSKTSARI